MLKHKEAIKTRNKPFDAGHENNFDFQENNEAMDRHDNYRP